LVVARAESVKVVVLPSPLKVSANTFSTPEGARPDKNPLMISPYVKL